MDLRFWVSDNTIRLVGWVHSTIVEYIIAEAQSAKSPERLYEKLSDIGFPSDGQGRDFVEALYLKIPRQQKPNENDTHKSKENGTSACLQLRSSYALLLEPDSETPLPVSDRKERREKRDMKEKRSKTRRRREDTEDQSASDEEDNGIRKRHRPEYEEEPREKHAAWTERD